MVKGIFYIDGVNFRSFWYFFLLGVVFLECVIEVFINESFMGLKWYVYGCFFFFIVFTEIKCVVIFCIWYIEKFVS